MSTQSIDPGLFSPDVLEFLRQLNNHRVRFMIVGGTGAGYGVTQLRPITP